MKISFEAGLKAQFLTVNQVGMALSLPPTYDDLYVRLECDVNKAVVPCDPNTGMGLIPNLMCDNYTLLYRSARDMIYIEAGTICVCRRITISTNGIVTITSVTRDSVSAIVWKNLYVNALLAQAQARLNARGTRRVVQLTALRDEDAVSTLVIEDDPEEEVLLLEAAAM